MGLFNYDFSRIFYKLTWKNRGENSATKTYLEAKNLNRIEDFVAELDERTRYLHLNVEDDLARIEEQEKKLEVSIEELTIVLSESVENFNAKVLEFDEHVTSSTESIATYILDAKNEADRAKDEADRAEDALNNIEVEVDPKTSTGDLIASIKVGKTTTQIYSNVSHEEVSELSELVGQANESLHYILHGGE